MIKIAEPHLILLNHNEINLLTTDNDRRSYAWDKGVFVQDTRLRNIELRIRLVEGYRWPISISIHYYQQISSSQGRTITDLKNNELRIVTEEADFWRKNPLYVDKIGILGNGMTQDCKIMVEAFKVG